MEINRKRVSYYYDENIGNFYYGSGHPMKPNRVRLADNLVTEYNLYKHMDVVQPLLLSAEEMVKFHTQEYIDFLENVTVANQRDYEKPAYEFLGKGEHSDCPIFDGIFEFCQLYSGGSVGSAYRLNHDLADIAINWSGGFHHAKKTEAAGFCYVNDIVLAALELLKCKSRVLYIDIDVHHGDGVEEAFYCSSRVLTLSFHKGGEFFPCTGHLEDVGTRGGKYHSINVPLEEGIDDDTFFSVFQPVVDAILGRFRPNAVILQCGADSLAGDRLGCFNLTFKGHGRCVTHVMGFGLPLLVLGGGGYTVQNVSRCWAYETSLCVGREISNTLPLHDYFDYYAPDYQLHIHPNKMNNRNTKTFIEKLTSDVLSTVSKIPIAPSVGMNDNLPASKSLNNETVSEEDYDTSDDKKPPRKRISLKAFSDIMNRRRFENGRMDNSAIYNELEERMENSGEKKDGQEGLIRKMNNLISAENEGEYFEGEDV